MIVLCLLYALPITYCILAIIGHPTTARARSILYNLSVAIFSIIVGLSSLWSVLPLLQPPKKDTDEAYPTTLDLVLVDTLTFINPLWNRPCPNNTSQIFYMRRVSSVQIFLLLCAWSPLFWWSNDTKHVTRSHRVGQLVNLVMGLLLSILFYGVCVWLAPDFLCCDVTSNS